MVAELISDEEKRQALARVLASRTFSRSDQLRSFLRYVCEAEFEGRAQALNEYVLGVSVLGRPTDYSPAEDSCVRSRAYELRNKLKTYYRLESPADPIQIDIRKGAYVPQFQRTNGTKPIETTELAPPVTVAVEPPVLIPSPDRTHHEPDRKPIWLRFGPAVVLLSLLALSAALVFYSTRTKTADKSADARVWTPEMKAFWQPFLSNKAPLVISFEIRLFFFSPSTGLVVRDYQINQPADRSASKPLASFQKHMGAAELQQTSDYADFGAVHAGFLLGRLLSTQNVEAGLKHSDSLGWEDLWNSNVIFVGKPDLNPAIRSALKNTNFADDDSGAIRNLHPLPGEPALYPSAATHGSGIKHALITVMPGPQSGRHVMILSGAGSEFLWALAEYVTDPAHVKEMVTHVRLPSGDMPGAFQVVIEATFESNVPIRIRYVTHRALKQS
jgi:hypothetical protein